MKPRTGLCTEYRKRVPTGSGSTLELWEVVLIISIEDHPIYGHAEYFWRIGDPHGYSSGGLSDIIADYTKSPTPSDKTWLPRSTFDPKKNGFPEKPDRSYKVSIRWQPKTPTQKG